MRVATLHVKAKMLHIWDVFEVTVEPPAAVPLPPIFPGIFSEAESRRSADCRKAAQYKLELKPS